MDKEGDIWKVRNPKAIIAEISRLVARNDKLYALSFKFYVHSMNLGPFYFDKKELFLVLAILLLVVAIYFNWPLWQFDKVSLLTLTTIILITKGLLPSIHNEVFFQQASVSIILLLFLPLFQVLLFYFITFGILKIIKVI